MLTRMTKNPTRAFWGRSTWRDWISRCFFRTSARVVFCNVFFLLFFLLLFCFTFMHGCIHQRRWSHCNHGIIVFLVAAFFVVRVRHVQVYQRCWCMGRPGHYGAAGPTRPERCRDASWDWKVFEFVVRIATAAIRCIAWRFAFWCSGCYSLRRLVVGVYGELRSRRGVASAEPFR